jgi:orotate phosphoribosyltransferase
MRKRSTDMKLGDTVPGANTIAPLSRQALIDHLTSHALRTDGPFTLRSGAVSDWYLDARQTTFDGDGAWRVGEAVLEVLDPTVGAVGGLTMGADPIAVATAMVSASKGRPLRAFSIRKSAKDHGTGGRLVGPVKAGDLVAILEDTTTSGAAAYEAAQHAREMGLQLVQTIALVDRSDGSARDRLEGLGVPFVALLRPADLGVI